MHGRGLVVVTLLGRPAFMLLQGALVRPVLPVTRPLPLVSFYDYGSARSRACSRRARG
ncbi:MAG TPA: hypothetical protein VM694_43525 [Polyangium sp.]|nr:hypothetical protein [Polyangium sp.]